MKRGCSRSNGLVWMAIPLSALVLLTAATQARVAVPHSSPNTLSYHLVLEFNGGIPSDLRVLPSGFDLIRPCDNGGPDCCPNHFLVFSVRKSPQGMSVLPHLISVGSRQAKDEFLTGHQPIPMPYVGSISIPGGHAQLHVSVTNPEVAGTRAEVHISLKAGNRTVLHDGFHTSGPVELLRAGVVVPKGHRETLIYVALTAYRSFQLRIYGQHPAPYAKVARTIKSFTAAIDDTMKHSTSQGKEGMSECEAAAKLIEAENK